MFGWYHFVFSMMHHFEDTVSNSPKNIITNIIIFVKYTDPYSWLGTKFKRALAG